jgi:hypothetical protein
VHEVDKQAIHSPLSHGGIVSIPRVKPPEHLTDEQKREWKTIVAALPADHFSQENLPLLVPNVQVGKPNPGIFGNPNAVNPTEPV